MARSGTRSLTPQIARRLAGQRMTRGTGRSLAEPNPDMLAMHHAAELAAGVVLGERIYDLLRSYQEHLADPPPALKVVRDAVAAKIVDEHALAGGVYEQVLAGLRGANFDPFLVRLMKDKPGIWHLLPDHGNDRPACGGAIDGNPSILDKMTMHVDLLRRHPIWHDNGIWCDRCRTELDARLTQFAGLVDQPLHGRLTDLLADRLADALAGEGDPVPALLEPVPGFVAAEIAAATGNRPTDWLRHCAPNDAFYKTAIEVYKSRAGGPTVMHAWERRAAAEAAVSRLLREENPLDTYTIVEQEILPTLILEAWLEVLDAFPAYLERNSLPEQKHIVNSSVTFALRWIRKTQHDHEGKQCFVSPAGHVLAIPPALLESYFS